MKKIRLRTVRTIEPWSIEEEKSKTVISSVKCVRSG